MALPPLYNELQAFPFCPMYHRGSSGPHIGSSGPRIRSKVTGCELLWLESAWQSVHDVVSRGFVAGTPLCSKKGGACNKSTERNIFQLKH
jgi:hypothetical protein